MDAIISYNSPHVWSKDVTTYNGYTKKETLRLAKKRGLEQKKDTILVVWLCNGINQKFERHGTRWYEVENWTY